MDMNDNTKSTNKTSEMAGADAANKPKFATLDLNILVLKKYEKKYFI